MDLLDVTDFNFLSGERSYITLRAFVFHSVNHNSLFDLIPPNDTCWLTNISIISRN